MLALASSQELQARNTTTSDSVESQLNAEELRELATVVDEMKHLRRQWLSQVPRQGQGFVHQGYGSGTAR